MSQNADKPEALGEGAARTQPPLRPALQACVAVPAALRENLGIFPPAAPPIVPIYGESLGCNSSGQLALHPSPCSVGRSMLPSTFAPHAAHFRLENASLLAYGAESVYDTPHAIESFVRDEWECDDFDFFDDNDTQAFVASDAEAIIVCFRGTETDRLCDWLTDADISLVPGPLEGRVHGGFYDALSDVWYVVDRAVRQLDRRQEKSLWITGHSLGGALASLAAARWLDRNRPVRGLYTFGQPRTGDRTFARNFNFAIKGSAFRFVNNSDLVARIPPRSLGFYHSGTFKYFTEDGNFEENFTWWNAFLDRWTFRFDWLLGSAFDSVDDHSMSIYRQRIEVAAARPALRLVSSAPAVAEEQIEPMPDHDNSPATLRMVAPRRRAA